MKQLLGSLSRTTLKQADIGLLVTRLVFGLTMAFGHGLGKVSDLGKFTEGVASRGMFLPEVMGPLAALSEFAGGILVAIGLLTRASALTLVTTMLVAAFYIHADDPFGKKEMAILYAAFFLGVLIAGPGRYSLDRVLWGRRQDG